MKYSFCTAWLCLMILTTSVFGQNSCAESLKKAQRAYDEGVIEKVSGLLKPCLEGQLDPDERLQAFKLIILSNLYDEKIEEAEKNMLKFLELDPEYEVNPASDPEEFAYLFNAFQTSPLWAIGGFAGISLPQVRQLEEFGTYNTKEKDFDEFENDKISFFIGVRLSRYVAKNVEAQVEAMYEQIQIKYSINPQFNDITQEETQSYIALPISFTYDFRPDKKLKPLIRFGGCVNYLTNASGNLSRSYSDGSPNTNESGTIDLKDFRKPLTFSVLGGIGAKFKVKKAYIVFDVRYRYGLNNLMKEDNRYATGDGKENYDRIFRLQQVDDNFGMDNLSFSIGYVRNIYKPRKRQNK